MRTLDRLLTFGVIAALIGAASPGLAAGPLTHVATLPLGAVAHEVALDGDFAYIATSLGLSIVDISDPTRPTLRSSTRVGRILSVAVKGTHAFLGGPSVDLRVVDVANVDHPAVVATRSVVGYVWDVALKDNLLYVASFGKIYLFDVTTPTNPVQLKTVLGVPTWQASGDDAANMALLAAGTTSGSAKITSVAVAGDLLLAVDFNYGRIYAWDITQPAHPVFRGAHTVPYTLRVQGDPVQGEIYALSSYGAFSAISSVPEAQLDPHVASHADRCAACGHFTIPNTDYGGLAVSSNGNYVVYAAGKLGIIQVLDVSDPTTIRAVGSWGDGLRFYDKLAENIGVALRHDDYIFVGAGLHGLDVLSYPGLSE